IAKVILEEDLWERSFVDFRTEGFDEWLNVMERVNVADCARITGVPEEQLRQAARLYAKPPKNGSCLIWGMGVTQHTNGTANAHAILNLALLTGQLGRFGSAVS